MIAAPVLASQFQVDPGSWFAWIVIGLIAGALIGGFLLGSLFGATGTVHFWGSIVVAFIGAVVLLAVLKLISGGRL